jgi:cytochrome bd-type quinol oxidase subunit 2
VRRLPFSIHQIAEYAIGLGLIAQAAQGGTAILPVIVGAAIVLSAALTDGPLAGWKAVSRPHHRIVDIVLAVTALLLAVLPWSNAAVTSRVVLGVAAALLGILILRTSYAPRVARPARSRGDVAEDIGRSAGRMVGKSVKAYRDRRPAP